MAAGQEQCADIEGPLGAEGDMSTNRSLGSTSRIACCSWALRARGCRRWRCGIGAGSLIGSGRLPGIAGERELIQPLQSHTALRLIGDGDEVAPGVTAVVTPGHSAGHTSYVVETSKGNRFIAFGDCFHTPAQMLHTEWFCDPDINPAAVPKARQRLIDELRTENTVGFAVHFGDQQFGTLIGDADALTWQPLPATVLFPPPRTA